MKDLELITTSSFDSQTIQLLGKVFETVWSEVAGRYSADEISAARSKLALFLLTSCRGDNHPGRLTTLARQSVRSWSATVLAVPHAISVATPAVQTQ